MSLPMPAHNTADLDTAGEILMVDIEAHHRRIHRGLVRSIPGEISSFLPWHQANLYMYAVTPSHPAGTSSYPAGPM